MGKYTCQHGATAAAKYFPKKLGKAVSKTTVQSIKKTYTQEQRKRPRGSDSAELEHLPPKKRGRKVMLGSDLDSKVQAYVHTVRERGGMVNSRIVIVGARGILFSSNHSLLAEHGGPIVLSQSWAQSLLKRMDFMLRKETTVKSKWTGENFQMLKQEFLEEIQAIITMEEIPPDLVMNWDQNGIKLPLHRHGRWRNVGLSGEKLLELMISAR